MKHRHLFCAALFLLAGCGKEEVAEVQSSLRGDSLCRASLLAASPQPNGRSLESTVAAARFLVKLTERAGAAEDKRVRERFSALLGGGARVEYLGHASLALELPVQATSGQVAALLPENQFVYVEPDLVAEDNGVSDDALVAKQWAHSVVNSAGAWSVSAGNRSVVVAVLDSGVDYRHPDLAANMWHNPGEVPNNGVDDDQNGYVDDEFGWNFVSDNNRPIAESGGSNHGTHVAGTTGAVGNNGIGISGHAQRVEIMALKFLGKSGSGRTSDAIRGIDYAVANGAKVINNSWGSTSRSQALSDAIDRARAKGVLFVAAAGNAGVNNDRTAFYPSSFPQDNIVRVAASTSTDKLASFSNYGVRSVDVAAPGSSIYSTVDGSSYGTKSGTSMAAPLISGVLATMIAARPELNYRQIKGALLDTVDRLSVFHGRVRSGGRVNAYHALSTVSSIPSNWTPPAVVDPCG